MWCFARTEKLPELEGEIFESVKPGLSAYADQPEKVRPSFIPCELVLLLLVSLGLYQAVQLLLIITVESQEKM